MCFVFLVDAPQDQTGSCACAEPPVRPDQAISMVLSCQTHVPASYHVLLCVQGQHENPLFETADRFLPPLTVYNLFYLAWLTQKSHFGSGVAL